MVNVFAIDSPCCPVRALQALLIRRPKSVYLFCHQDGKPLTRYQFGAVLAKATVTLKLPKANYQTHSFRLVRLAGWHRKVWQTLLSRNLGAGSLTPSKDILGHDQ